MNDLVKRVVARHLGKQASDWESDEKHGEWNLILRQDGGRISAFMKNPQGGGGGGNRYTSLKSAVAAEIHRVGWGSKHINPHGKNKVWVVLRVWDPATENYVPKKQWWVDVPKELFQPKGEPTQEQLWEMATR